MEVSFWNRVSRRRPDECWDWIGVVTPYGYGVFNNRRAHRLSYQINVGEPGAFDVLHTCDNRKCCNPNHLYLGTDIENARDRVVRNRTAKGSKNAHAVLTEEQVSNIKASLRAGALVTPLAAQYGVTRMTIRRIRMGSHWRHVL